ncbi:probable WRKY transcription factor 53 [Mercurialis annua]|uniref:probable WRKY transcription factor 53 n=1 Tax=Mercurialis annua TaxID=3986 RepID=UPI00215DD735|nr:probable WRKY transcription factor 53 [Mercurialis annua]
MEKNILMNELTQGKELTEQLKNHLNPSSSPETRQFLVDKILSSYEKALSLLDWDAVHRKLITSESESLQYPFSDNTSPRSEISDCKFRTQRNVFKKRKTQQRWTEQVKVCSGTGLEGPTDDGYSWRKYGQKDILGAKFPRGYYRCSHRHTQGCLAIKQVQRSDNEASTFEVTYRGRHTCVQASHLDQNQQGILIKTENLDTRKEISPSFSFLNERNDFVGTVSPTFISPETSESNCYSTCQFDNFGMAYNVQTPESELKDMISLTNSPVGHFDFSNLDFETNFEFGNLELEFLA